MENTGERILAVDDNRANRLILEKRLANEGYHVETAAGGAEALERLRAPHDGPAPFDLVVLDIMMPDIDGFEVLRQVRQSASSSALPVIMVTAIDRSEDIVAALKAGANDYVTKPIDMPVLLARVETHLALKRTHAALKGAQHSLVHAAKMESIGYLAAGVAHEIRNPLAQIQMGADALRSIEALQADPTAETVLGIIGDAVAKADRIVEGLMGFSSGARLDLQPGDLGKIARESLGVVRDELEKAGIELETGFDGALPPVDVAAVEMQQVLVAIFMNAIQAMPAGGKLTVRARRRVLEAMAADEGSRTGNRPRGGDEVVAIEIDDTGPGIPEEKLLTVFDAFYTTKATGKATGLGLTVAKKVVDLHGGLLTVENRGDRPGARVTIALKAADTLRTTV